MHMQAPNEAAKDGCIINTATVVRSPRLLRIRCQCQLLLMPILVLLTKSCDLVTASVFSDTFDS